MRPSNWQIPGERFSQTKGACVRGHTNHGARVMDHTPTTEPASGVTHRTRSPRQGSHTELGAHVMGHMLTAEPASWITRRRQSPRQGSHTELGARVRGHTPTTEPTSWITRRPQGPCQGVTRRTRGPGQGSHADRGACVRGLKRAKAHRAPSVQHMRCSVSSSSYRDHILYITTLAESLGKGRKYPLHLK